MKYKVTKKAKRPASKESKCFYCNQEIGDYHKDDCVLIRKKVKLRATIEYEVTVPSSWGEGSVEFNRNDGSWCASNLIDELKEIDKEYGCLCDFVEFKYLEDASKPFLEE